MRNVVVLAAASRGPTRTTNSLSGIPELHVLVLRVDLVRTSDSGSGDEPLHRSLVLDATLDRPGQAGDVVLDKKE